MNRKGKQIIRVLSFMLCMVLMISGITPSQISAEEADSKSGVGYSLSDFENNEILAVFDDNATGQEIQAFIEQLNVVSCMNDENTYIFTAEDETKLSEVLDALESSNLVEWIQPNYVYEDSSLWDMMNSSVTGTYLAGGNTVTYSQWGIKNDGTQTFYDYYDSGQKYIQEVSGIDTDIAPFWDYMKDQTGTEVIVALLDSGVDISHEALQGKLWKNEGETAGDGIDNDKNGYVDDYDGWNTYKNDTDLTDEVEHGTHCAGIIAANGTDNVWGVTGTADIKIMPVKVFSDTVNGNENTSTATSYSILKGMEYAEANGATICNMSLGMYGSDVVLANYMKSSDMLFVCAAGNDGKDMDNKPIYPAYYNYSNIISVANVRWDGVLHSTSNYQQYRVTIAAPGTDIYSTIPGNSYDYLSGTSMAAPYVTGVAALLASYINNQTAQSLKQRILLGAKEVSQLNGKVEANGIVDAYASLFVDADAPAITKKVTVYKSKGYATVSVSCADVGDAGFKLAAYMKGQLTADDFDGGNSGTLLDATDKFKVTSSGYYTIYAVDNNGNEQVVQLKVTIPVPTKVKLSKTSVTLKVGKTYKLSPKVVPSGVYVKYSYTSSNKKVATVSSAGKVTAKKAGTVTITIKTQNGKKVTCKIKVTKK